MDYLALFGIVLETIHFENFLFFVIDRILKISNHIFYKFYTIFAEINKDIII